MTYAHDYDRHALCTCGHNAYWHTGWGRGICDNADDPDSYCGCIGFNATTTDPTP